jgi:hypothetical protein
MVMQQDHTWPHEHGHHICNIWLAVFHPSLRPLPAPQAVCYPTPLVGFEVHHPACFYLFYCLFFRRKKSSLEQAVAGAPRTVWHAHGLSSSSPKTKFTPAKSKGSAATLSCPSASVCLDNLQDKDNQPPVLQPREASQKHAAAYEHVEHAPVSLPFLYNMQDHRTCLKFTAPSCLV